MTHVFVYIAQTHLSLRPCEGFLLTYTTGHTFRLCQNYFKKENKRRQAEIPGLATRPEHDRVNWTERSGQSIQLVHPTEHVINAPGMLE